MTDKKSNDSRRKLLKSIAAGSGAVVAGKSLPESWSKPVINSIVLPSHAALTDGGDASTTPEATTTPECCLVVGTYCFSNFYEGDDLIIYVAASGKITFDIDGVSEFGTTILCTGEDFSAANGGYTVKGHIGCNATSIIGTISVTDGPPNIPYEAKPENCG